MNDFLADLSQIKGQRVPPRQRVLRACEECSQQFFVRRADYNRGRGRFCSASCATKTQNREMHPYVPVAERPLVKDANGCWNWPAARNSSGYGVTSVDGRMAAAHRQSYIEAKGEIPPGLFVCHRCDNPPCVNPEHLFLGTVLDNSRDMVSKGRASRWRAFLTHCKHGHPFDAANTIVAPRTGYRKCRECVRATGRKSWRAKHAQQ
jgi:hypothetical protein